MDSKPLEFLQAIIARMAANSTQMKTWNVALEFLLRELYTAKVLPGAPDYHLTPAPVTAGVFLQHLIRPAVLGLHFPILAIIYWVSCG